VRRPARATALLLLRVAERARRTVLLLVRLRVRAAGDERLARSRAADARRVRGRAADAGAVQRGGERRRVARLQERALLGLVVLCLELRVRLGVGAVRLLELVRAAAFEREAFLGRLDAVLEQADLGVRVARDRVALRLEDGDALRRREASGSSSRAEKVEAHAPPARSW